MHNEGFGKKWIERILGKVDKDQGIANAGKVLGIGADGQVTPVEQSGGSGESRLSGTFSASDFAQHVLNRNIKIGDNISMSVFVTGATIDSGQLITIDEANSIKALSITTKSYNTNVNVTSVVSSISETDSAFTIYLLPTACFYKNAKSVTISGETFTCAMNFTVIPIRLYISKTDPRVNTAVTRECRLSFTGPAVINREILGTEANESSTYISADIKVNI